mmetsp:Transcript_8983/g.23017  ORF Transcript_8983/g.23017 Transcript_8983/m.23017 type:complete len:226 (-) Transcript_8983:55-732(-)
MPPPAKPSDPRRKDFDDKICCATPGFVWWYSTRWFCCRRSMRAVFSWLVVCTLSPMMSTNTTSISFLATCSGTPSRCRVSWKLRSTHSEHGFLLYVQEQQRSWGQRPACRPACGGRMPAPKKSSNGSTQHTLRQSTFRLRHTCPHAKDRGGSTSPCSLARASSLLSHSLLDARAVSKSATHRLLPAWHTGHTFSREEGSTHHVNPPIFFSNPQGPAHSSLLLVAI